MSRLVLLDGTQPVTVLLGVHAVIQQQERLTQCSQLLVTAREIRLTLSGRFFLFPTVSRYLIIVSLDAHSSQPSSGTLRPLRVSLSVQADF